MNPLPIVFVVVGALVFEGLLFGSEIAASSFAEIEETTFSDCGNVGEGLINFDDQVGCVLSNIFAFFANIFKIIFGIVAFFVSLITFNVPGAPWYVRAVVGSFFLVAIAWPIVALLRGTQ